MKTSENGIALIKTNEGFVAHVYDDNGKQAIAYGHDLSPVEIASNMFAAGLNLEQGDALLRNDLATRYEPAVNRHVPAGCTQGQFDALVDFCYEFGEGGLTQLLAHGWDQVTAQLPRWCHVRKNGVLVESSGLKERRRKEAAMFAA